jgi:putative flippase GtrA
LSFLARLWQTQFLRFAVIGTAAFVVDASTLYAALWFGLGLYAGRVVSYLVAATFTWYGNRRITFVHSRAEGVGPAAAEWLKFLVANLGGGAVNYAIYAALIASFAMVRAYPVLGVAAGSLAGLVVNFTLSKFVVFRARG